MKWFVCHKIYTFMAGTAINYLVKNEPDGVTETRDTAQSTSQVHSIEPCEFDVVDVKNEFESVVSTPDIDSTPLCPTCGQSWSASTSSGNRLGLLVRDSQEQMESDREQGPGAKRASVRRKAERASNDENVTGNPPFRFLGRITPGSGKSIIVENGQLIDSCGQTFTVVGGYPAQSGHAIVLQSIENQKNVSLSKLRPNVSKYDDLPLSQRIVGRKRTKATGRRTRSERKKLKDPEENFLSGDNELPNSPVESEIAYNECSDLFPSKSSLRKHEVESHAGTYRKYSQEAISSGENEAPIAADGHTFTCSECSELFPSHSALNKHKLRSHTKAKKFKCTYCKHYFQTKEYLKKHQGSAHGVDNKLICAVCEKILFTKQSLRFHLGKAHKLVPLRYKCNHCAKGFFSKDRYENHLKKNSVSLTCPICGKNFARKYGLEAHILTHSGTMPYTCNVCQQGFVNSGNLTRHMARHMGKSFLCETCGKNFTRKHTLRDHMSTHTGVKAYLCEICSKSFAYKNLLLSHLATHQSFLCAICAERFGRKGQLRDHLCFHHGIGADATRMANILPDKKVGDSPPNSFMCSVCGKGFLSKGGLNAHGAVHASEKPYACTQCHKTFTSAIYLRVHRVVHSETRPFLCPRCGKSFKQKSVLKQHMITHTGVKPYQCTLCNAGFTQPSNLKRHYLVHTGGDKPFLCPTCNKAFAFKQTLKTHLFTHTGEKRFGCDICHKKFSEKGSLTKHLKVHGGEGLSFECPLCKAKFASSNALDRHRAAPLRCQEINCTECGTQFKNCKMLSDHCIVHH